MQDGEARCNRQIWERARDKSSKEARASKTPPPSLDFQKPQTDTQNGNSRGALSGQDLAEGEKQEQEAKDRRSRKRR